MNSHEPKRAPGYDPYRTYVREVEFHEFQDSMMAALSAEARFNWMNMPSQKKNIKGDSGLGDAIERSHNVYRPYSEVVVAVLLHLVAQLFQFVLIIYFTVSFIVPLQLGFSTPTLVNNTYILDKAIEAHNFLMVPIEIQGICSMNQSFMWTHRIMMMILMLKMLPELGNSMWLIYRIWMIEGRPNHDIDSKPEKEDFLMYEWKDRDQLKKDLDGRKESHTRSIEKQYEWRDEDLVTKDWKIRLLALNAVGNVLKINKVADYTQDDFPVMIIETEQEEVHNIGKFGIPWKIFVTLFILLPSLLINCYMVSIGAQLIAYTGAPGRLVKLALKVKFLIKIPEVVYSGYASNDLKAYLDGSCFYIAEDTQPVRPDAWSTWLGPIVKLSLTALFGYAIYEWGFHEIIQFRAKCDEYFDTFEGMVQGPAEMFSIF